MERRLLYPQPRIWGWQDLDSSTGTPALPRHVTLGKSISFPEPQLENKDDKALFEDAVKTELTHRQYARAGCLVVL